MAIWSIIHFTLLPDYRIEVSFADGTSGIADLAPRLSQGPLGDGFDPLCDEPVEGTTLFTLAGAEHEAQQLTGVRVSVLTTGFLLSRFRDRVLQEAEPL